MRVVVKRKLSWRTVAILLGITLGILLVAYFIASSQDFFRANGSDFFSLWLAPRLLVDGKNPYNPRDWIPPHAFYGAHWVANPTYLYPLPLAILLIPLGVLPIEVAATVWVAINLVAILIACKLVLSIWDKKWPYKYLIPLLCGIFLFRAVAETLRLGQIDAMLLLCLAIGLYLWHRENWFTGGLVIALTIIKPQIGIPLLGLLSFWLLCRRLWKPLAGEAITVILLFLAGWVVNHSWIQAWVGIGSTKLESTYCCTPTLWGLAFLSCRFNSNCFLPLGAILATILAIIMLFVLYRLPLSEPTFAIGLSIPAALLISPYLWVYSQAILVIPILMIMVLLDEMRWPYLAVATFPLIIALFASSIVIVSIQVGIDALSSIIPLSILIMLGYLYKVRALKHIFNSSSVAT
jgi:hypothetical protein